MDTELSNAKNIKISIDGSAELLTPNPLPRKTGPWTNWKNMQ